MRRLFALRRFSPWRRGLPDAPECGGDGPRIVVIGNCQARGVARALRVLSPDARVTYLPTGRLGKEHRNVEEFAAKLRSYDHVFAQVFPTGLLPDGGSKELLGLHAGARQFPAIVFPAFHPDAVYVGDLNPVTGGNLVPSPLHTLHSAMALFGFLRGLTPSETVELYREAVFERLGYLDLWSPSAQDLVASTEAIGFGLGSELLRWSRSGAFMHTINHPKPIVLGDIAERLLRDAGLSSTSLPIDAYMTDDLLDDVIWPIYEPVAAVYGVKGASLFKQRRKPGEPARLLSLQTFVSESYAIYGAMPRERLRCHRTDHWAGQPEICALFDAARA